MSIFNKFSRFSVLVFLLISTSASASAQDDKFIFAAKFDDVPKLTLLINQGVDPNIGDSIRSETALMWAVRENALRAIDYLLHHPKVDINALAKNGDTALMIACYLGKFAIVQNFISNNVKVNQEGWTALHYAAVVGHIDIVEILLKNKANVNALSPNNTTPLMMATRSGKLDLIETLIKNGADVSLKNSQGMNAYDFAKQAEMSSITQYLESLK
jgi:ankyrin repeat protein